MASFPFSTAVPADYVPGTAISQMGALSGGLNARRAEPMIRARGGAVCRLTFAGGQAIDPFNVWTRVGSPGAPGLATGAGVREGAGPFTDSDYWQLGAGPDPLDFAGNFSGAVVFMMVAALAAEQALFSNGHPNQNGYYASLNSAPEGALVTSQSGALQAAIGAAALSFNVPHVVCFGRSDGMIYVKQDLQAIASSVTSGQTPAVAVPARLGRHDAAGSAFASGYILELWLSTQPASDALFAAIANDVKATLGTTW